MANGEYHDIDTPHPALRVGAIQQAQQVTK